MRTWLTERFGTGVPVVSAPMAYVAGGGLAAAVSTAGGLGMIGVGGATPAAWVTEQAAIARASGRPFGIGLMAWVLPQHPDLLEATLDARPDLVSVSFGDYRDAVARLSDAGIVTATQVATVAEAREAEANGVELVVARGLEAGGHGRAEVATLPLLQGVLDAVAVPVLAAGGIATGRGLAGVLAAGAQGAWVGTAFLTSHEAQTTDRAAQRLIAADETSTVYGRVFDVGMRRNWPAGIGGRALRNAFFDTWVGREDELAADDEAAEALVRAAVDGDYDTASLYAGQAVGALTCRRPAADVVADFATAQEHLDRVLR